MALLYTFYGDDFTGSTDVLEQLATHGVRCALFLAPPTADELDRFPDIQAFGVAGDSRSRSPEWMTVHLPEIFAALDEFRAPVVHYKVCSTFDSSPTHGSIGRATELGMDTFHPAFVPVVVGAPHLRRFVYEGKLFAAAPDGMIHRIDRHPMSRHPVTPMREPDLREHLRKQTKLAVGHIGHERLTNATDLSAALETELRSGARVVLFDTLDPPSLELTGDLLWQAASERPLFSAGSSGLTAALVSAWRKRDVLEDRPCSSQVKPVSPLLVVSGSCSQTTARQIAWAQSQGFCMMEARPERLLDQNSGSTYGEDLRKGLAASLGAGRDTVLYTSMGDATSEIAGDELGRRLGAVVRALQATTSIPRIVFCGGDTSSHATQQLGLCALTWKANLQSGAPLCQAHFPDPKRAPLELVLKGGQMGSDDFFAIVKGSSE